MCVDLQKITPGLHLPSYINIIYRSWSFNVSNQNRKYLSKEGISGLNPRSFVKLKIRFELLFN